MRAERNLTSALPADGWQHKIRPGPSGAAIGAPIRRDRPAALAGSSIRSYERTDGSKNSAIGRALRPQVSRTYSPSQAAMSPADGTRPKLTTVPSITSPGVLMIP